MGRSLLLLWALLAGALVSAAASRAQLPTMTLVPLPTLEEVRYRRRRYSLCV